MTIASEITKLNTNLTNSYSAVSNKGGTLPQAQNFDNLATAISSIPSGGGGYSELPSYQIDNGVANRRSGALTGNEFNGVTSIGDYGLYYAFYGCTGITGDVNLSLLTSVGVKGMQYAFYGCTGITSVNLSSLESVSGSSTFTNAFNGCTGITSVNLSSLKSVSGSSCMSSIFGGCTGLTGNLDLSSLVTVSGTDSSCIANAFNGCTGITSVDLSSLESVSAPYGMNSFLRNTSLVTLSFPKLTTISGNSGLSAFCLGCTELTTASFPKLTTLTGSNVLSSAFNGCSSLEKVYFPKLTTISQNNAFGNNTSAYIFYNCTALTEIHFNSNAQSVISGLSGYSTKWGATNATIYFDQ